MAVGSAAAALHINNPLEIVEGSQRVAERLKEAEKEIDRLKAQMAQSRVDEVIRNADKAGDTLVVTALINGASGDMLRKMCEGIGDKVDDAVAVLAGVQEGKLTFCCSCTKTAVKKGLKAGNIVREVAKIAGGNGGGKPDMAMAGGKDVTKADEALYAVKGIVEAAL